MVDRDLMFLGHILSSIDAIEEFSEGLTREELGSNRMRQGAIVREIEIIGEAVKNISNQTRESYCEVEWSGIAKARDKMIHHYFDIDLNIVWEIIQGDLPKLKKQLIEIKSSIENKEK